MCIRDSVWVNTPHLNIKKSVEKKEYNVGETVKYTLVVTNVHEGILARDIVTVSYTHLFMIKKVMNR